MNPCYMKKFVQMPENRHSPRYPLNLAVPKPNQVAFGKRSLRSLGPKIWISLPEHVKSSGNERLFKLNIKNWNGSKCCCNICEHRL